jgi:hypothetical protein
VRRQRVHPIGRFPLWTGQLDEVSLKINGEIDTL